MLRDRGGCASRIEKNERSFACLKSFAFGRNNNRVALGADIVGKSAVRRLGDNVFVNLTTTDGWMVTFLFSTK